MLDTVLDEYLAPAANNSEHPVNQCLGIFLRQSERFAPGQNVVEAGSSPKPANFQRQVTTLQRDQGRRQDVVGGRKAPATLCMQQCVVARVVVVVGDRSPESQASGCRRSRFARSCSWLKSRCHCRPGGARVGGVGRLPESFHARPPRDRQAQRLCQVDRASKAK